jgi:nitrogen-specific signal transduction histidine kinase
MMMGIYMSNNYLRQNSEFALEAFPEAIILVDENHTIKFINPAAVRLFQISNVETLLENSFSSFPGGSGLMNFPQRVDSYNSANKFAINKIPNPQPNDIQRWSIDVNNRLFNFQAVPIFNEQNQDCGFIIYADECSKERKASELLHSLFSELLTPLHSILGHSELFLQEKGHNILTEEQREWTTAIKKNAQNLLTLREYYMEESKKIK